MFVSARRIAAKLGIRRPLVCYQGALVADPVSGEVLVHRPIEAPLAREILRAMPTEHARHSNLYIDDELYVWEENEATRRYSQVSGVEMHIVGPLADWIERPTTKIVTVGLPDEMDVLRDELQPRFGSRAFIAKSLPYFLEFAAPGVSKASGLALLADLLGFSPSRRSRSATPRTTARCSTGPGCGLAVANAERPAQGRGRRRDPVGARRRRRAAARGARRRTRLGCEGMLDIRLLRTETERVREALARREADGLLDEVLALDERRRALQTQVDALRAERNAAAQAIGEAKRAGRDAAAEMAAAAELRDRLAVLEEQLREVDAAFETAMLALPNLPHPSAADGMLEEDAQLHEHVQPAQARVRLGAPRPPRPRGRHDRHRARRARSRDPASPTCSATSCACTSPRSSTRSTSSSARASRRS